MCTCMHTTHILKNLSINKYIYMSVCTYMYSLPPTWADPVSRKWSSTAKMKAFSPRVFSLPSVVLAMLHPLTPSPIDRSCMAVAVAAQPSAKYSHGPAAVDVIRIEASCAVARRQQDTAFSLSTADLAQIQVSNLRVSR